MSKKSFDESSALPRCSSLATRLLNSEFGSTLHLLIPIGTRSFNVLSSQPTSAFSPHRHIGVSETQKTTGPISRSVTTNSHRPCPTFSTFPLTQAVAWTGYNSSCRTAGACQPTWGHRRDGLLTFRFRLTHWPTPPVFTTLQCPIRATRPLGHSAVYRLFSWRPLHSAGFFGQAHRSIRPPCATTGIMLRLLSSAISWKACSPQTLRYGALHIRNCDVLHVQCMAY